MVAAWSSIVIAAALGLAGDPPVGRPEIGSVVADPVFDAGPGGRGRPLVLVFLKAHCPVAELYAGTIARMAGEYGPRGVDFVGVAAEGAEVDRFAEAHGFGFPIRADGRGALAAKVGARRTPEVVVLDGRRAIRYRGRIDDQYAVGTRKAGPARSDLREALEELLGGRPVSQPEAEAVGCPIARPSARPASVGPTYSHDVAPILGKRCVGCHRAGQVGPFPLTSYREAEAWAGPIADAVEGGRMPPWHADPAFGKFTNDARLSAAEKQLIAEWAEGGSPEGDPVDLPPPPSYPEGWRIDRPDLVVAMAEASKVPAEGVVDYRTFEVDPGFTKDMWVRASEIRPSNRKVVHHCNVFLRDPKGRSEIDAPGELGSVCLDAMTPGSPPMVLPSGAAKRIPAGWHVVFVVHYAPVGTPQVDRTSIGLVFANPGEVRREVATNLLLDPDLSIPPHAPDHRVERSRTFDDDVLLLAMFPHMHLRGKSFRYEVAYPDGRRETLLDVPRYDFRWQNRYELSEPKRLPAGSTLTCVARFDNSAANPANPDPSATVKAGQQSWDEMFNGYYDIVLADQDLTRPEPWSRSARRLSRRWLTPALQVAGLLGALPAWLLWKRSGRRAEPTA